MYQIVDWIFLAVLCGIVVFSAARGFVRAAYRLFSLIAAIAVATTFSAPVGKIIYDTFLYENIQSAVESGLTSAVEGTAGALPVDAWVERMPEGLHAVATLFGVDLSAAAEQIVLGVTTEEYVRQTAVSVAEPIATSAANLLATLLLFLCAMLALRIFRFVLDALVKLPILRSVNRLLGFVLGVLEAGVIGILLAKALVAVCGVYAVGHPEFPLPDLMENTRCISYFAKLFSL